MEKTMQKKLRTPDGDVVFYMEGKMHNWDGPAFIPKGDKKKAEYYIYGVRYSKEDWEAAKRDWTGLPWYKNPGIIERF
jgi:hypothetical protein